MYMFKPRMDFFRFSFCFLFCFVCFPPFSPLFIFFSPPFSLHSFFVPIPLFHFFLFIFSSSPFLSILFFCTPHTFLSFFFLISPFYSFFQIPVNNGLLIGSILTISGQTSTWFIHSRYVYMIISVSIYLTTKTKKLMIFPIHDRRLHPAPKMVLCHEKHYLAHLVTPCISVGISDQRC